VKRWVSTQQEEPVEYQQLNEEDINTAGELVSAFQELLEKKLAEVSHRVRNNTGEPPASDSEIGLVEDVVNAYNRIISIVINPGNTQQTKEALHTDSHEVGGNNQEAGNPPRAHLRSHGWTQ
jgi:hypothetical protein